MISKWERMRAELEMRKCPICAGLGSYDDAEPGDIAFDTFPCNACNYTGFRDGKTIKFETQTPPESSDSSEPT